TGIPEQRAIIAGLRLSRSRVHAGPGGGQGLVVTVRRIGEARFREQLALLVQVTHRLAPFETFGRPNIATRRPGAASWARWRQWSARCRPRALRGGRPVRRRGRG